nr:NDUFA4 family protein [Candidatus Liberibacter asiaticus]
RPHLDPPSANFGSRFCTYCNNFNHIVDVCLKKHSYPEWYKLKQAERKKKFSQTTDFASQLSCVTTHGGNFDYAFISFSNTWLIDSGVTDHMTSNSSL